jgi:hypothetical protein
MAINRFDDLFGEADTAFSGTYKNQLNDLMGLSKNEIEEVSPDGLTDMSTYSKLIDVVKQASKDNISQADLISNIKTLGQTAVNIAKKVPTLAGLF